jgi:hypothetical protein
VVEAHSDRHPKLSHSSVRGIGDEIVVYLERCHRRWAYVPAKNIATEVVHDLVRE